MKPKEIIEKEKNGFIELTDSQIEKYITFDNINGCIYLYYEYELNGYKETFIYGLKQSCDYSEKEIKKDRVYTKNSDVYYYNDDLQFFFKSPDSDLKEEKDLIKLIRRDLKDNR